MSVRQRKEDEEDGAAAVKVTHIIHENVERSPKEMPQKSKW